MMPLVRLHDFFNEEPKYHNASEPLFLVVTEYREIIACLPMQSLGGRR